MTALPLSGYRILNLGGELGRYAGLVLAEFGADVLTLPAAGRLPSAPIRIAPDGTRVSLADDHYRRHQRILALDPAGDTAAQLRGWAAGAHVVILAPEEHPYLFDRPMTRDARPGWVPDGATLCLLSAYGLDGPRAGEPQTAATGFADSGLMHSVGPESGPPIPLPAPAVNDELGAHAATAIMAAILHRAPADGGTTIELCRSELLAFRSGAELAFFSQTGRDYLSRAAAADPPPAGVWEVRDGLVEIGAFHPPQWLGICQLLGDPAELSDPELVHRKNRLQCAQELREYLASRFRQFSVQELVDLAQANRVPTAPLNIPADLLDDPQLRTRGFWQHRCSADGTYYVAPGTPFRATTPLTRQSSTVTAADPAGSSDSAPPVPSTGPIRVLSLGSALAGNLTASMLASLGAEVVKVESPSWPDPVRRGPLAADQPQTFDPTGFETTSRFAFYARGVRSISLDLKEPADIATFRRLAAVADVVLENFAGGVLDRLGIGADTLLAANLRLIVLSISGYGRTGPAANYRAFGTTINAHIGLTTSWYSHPTQCDWAAVAHALPAVYAALLARQRDHRGTHLDISQLEATAALLAPLYLAAAEPTTPPEDDATPANEVATEFPAVVATRGPDDWLLVDIDRPGQLDVLRELFPPAAGGGSLRSRVQEWAAPRGAEAAAQLLRDAGIPAAQVRRISDLTRDPALAAARMLRREEHPDLGELLFPAPIYHGEIGVAGGSLRPAPRLGEHTAEVLCEWLGAAP